MRGAVTGQEIRECFTLSEPIRRSCMLIQVKGGPKFRDLREGEKFN